MFLQEFLVKLSKNRICNFILILLSSIVLGVASLYFAAETIGYEMFQSYFEIPLIALLNILPCIWLVMLLWFATKRAYVSFILSSLIVMGLTIASWFKLQFRNDPVMFEDIFLVKEATNMSEKYRLFITQPMIIALVVFLAIAVILFFSCKGNLSFKARIAGVAVCLVLTIPFTSVYTNQTIYTQETQNLSLINQWSSTENYISKGFVYPFLYSIQDAIQSPPDGYNEKSVEQLLSKYSDADIPEDKKVNIVGIMLEAYSDLSVYDQIQFQNDPYEFYHKLEKESISGNLLTNIFAGGTVNTERAFLTGFCNQGSFRSKTNSYAWYFKNQGYTVTGSHPSYEWFYNRVNINENLGFESYNFMENYFNKLTDDEVAMDRILMPEIVKLYEQHKQESDKPYFSFNVTYQGHGPYGTDQNYYAKDYVKSGLYSAESENILNNYFGTIDDTNAHLEKLVNYYRNCEEPVVLVLFGDHKPWLGDNSTVYAELGIDLNYTDPEAGFKNYYGTRYLIWANDAAKKTLNNDFVGQGPDIGPYFLMNLLFRECGWQGPAYMQAIDDVSRKVPVISVSGLYMQDGVVTDKLTPENKKLLSKYLSIEYYLQKHFIYDDK